MERVAIFVDVQNIYYTVKSTYQCDFNYQKFWNQATQNKEIVAAFAYAINKKRQQTAKLPTNFAQYWFTVSCHIQRSDGSAKGDWDVGITLDVIDYASKS